MKLSIDDSNALKGIAILMMLWHHLFYYSNGSFNDIYINGYGLAKTSALACKVCVAIFVFVSGYGLMEKYKDQHQSRMKHFYRRHFVKKQ